MPRDAKFVFIRDHASLEVSQRFRTWSEGARLQSCETGSADFLDESIEINHILCWAIL